MSDCGAIRDTIARPDGVVPLSPRARRPVAPPDASFSADVSRDEYGFLRAIGVTQAVINDALVRAQAIGVEPQKVLVSQGVVTDEAYVAALAIAWHVPVVDPSHVPALRLRRPAKSMTDDPTLPPLRSVAWGAGLQPLDAILDLGDGRALVLDALARRPRDLAQILQALEQRRVAVALTTPTVLRRVVERDLAPRLAHRAAHGLRLRQPKESAAHGIAAWQAVTLLGIPAAAFGASLVVPTSLWWGLLAILTLPFWLTSSVRLAALCHVWLCRHPSPLASRQTAGELPYYTVIVPLFDEARVVPGLLRALRHLDYPAEKLDIKLVVEEADAATRAAILQCRLDQRFEIIVVPDGQPRTKPRALNYALSFARGTLVTIYDAEDIPDADQLQKAAHAFASAAPGLGCVQARLAIDNGGASWLAQQFTIEYLTLFEGFLPALQRMSLPLPLGGTSNHFPLDVLREVGGWDAFNVTEDADLGLRLARHGYRVAMLPSRTHEEAPDTLWPWIKQRTRWMKGYMQTWSVHMRQPDLWRQQVGWRGFLGMQAVFGGVVLSALAIPLFLASLIAGLWRDELLDAPATPIALTFYWLALVNLAVGWSVPLLMSFVTIVRQRRYDLLLTWLSQPVYWLLMSIAAWRAVLQICTAPYRWEKTAHGVSKRRTSRMQRAARRHSGFRPLR